jgi:hypothetical protein
LKKQIRPQVRKRSFLQVNQRALEIIKISLGKNEEAVMTQKKLMVAGFKSNTKAMPKRSSPTITFDKKDNP